MASALVLGKVNQQHLDHTDWHLNNYEKELATAQNLFLLGRSMEARNIYWKLEQKPYQLTRLVEDSPYLTLGSRVTKEMINAKVALCVATAQYELCQTYGLKDDWMYRIRYVVKTLSFVYQSTSSLAKELTMCTDPLLKTYIQTQYIFLSRQIAEMSIRTDKFVEERNGLEDSNYTCVMPERCRNMKEFSTKVLNEVASLSS